MSDALSPPSCWLSLEGGLLYAFVGPAAVIVLVCAPFRVPGGAWPQGSTPLCTLAPTWGFPCQEGTW